LAQVPIASYEWSTRIDERNSPCRWDDRGIT
jgi:hypothetical protein